MMAKGTYAGILLATADLDGTFQQVQASGADIVQEPTEQPYGVRDCRSRGQPDPHPGAALSRPVRH
jgi:predicted enzyme related to lactoylglutathione lyase